jgi:hypothetical protein
MTECVGTIAELEGTPVKAKCVIVEGYHKAGDGGGGTFYWDDSFKGTSDGGTTFMSRTVPPPPQGCWRRIFDDFVSIKWFGAKGDMSGPSGQYKGTVLKSTNELNASQPVFTEQDVDKVIVLWYADATIAKPFITAIFTFVNAQRVVLKHVPSIDMKNAFIAWGNDDTNSIKEAMKLAKETGFAVYLPPGHFIVTTTLNYITDVLTERDEGYTPHSPYPLMKHGLQMFGAGVQVSFLHNLIETPVLLIHKSTNIL